MRVSETIDSFEAFMCERGRTLSDNTRKKYCYDLKNFSNYVEDIDITEIRIDHVGRFKEDLRQGGNKTSTVAGALSSLAKYARYLKVMHGLSNIDIDELKEMRPLVHQESPKWLSPSAIDLMMKVAKRPEDAPLVELLFNTGIRIAEFMEIRGRDITFGEIDVGNGEIRQQSWLRVLGKGNKPRTVPLNARAFAAIEAYRKHLRTIDGNAGGSNESTRLFPRQYLYYWRRLKRMGRIAEIKVSPHVLRHSFGTALNEAGVSTRDIADLMGHKSLDTTMRYTAVKDRAKIAAVNVLVDPGNALTP